MTRKEELEKMILNEQFTIRNCQFNVEQWSKLIDQIDKPVDAEADLKIAVEAIREIVNKGGGLTSEDALAFQEIGIEALGRMKVNHE